MCVQARSQPLKGGGGGYTVLSQHVDMVPTCQIGFSDHPRSGRTCGVHDSSMLMCTRSFSKNGHWSKKGDSFEPPCYGPGVSMLSLHRVYQQHDNDSLLLNMV